HDALPIYIPLHTESPDDSGSASGPARAVLFTDAYHLAKEQVLSTFEKEYVTRLVARASGNMSRAARMASVDRTTLYRLLERHGFRRDLSDGAVGEQFSNGLQSTDSFPVALNNDIPPS